MSKYPKTMLVPVKCKVEHIAFVGWRATADGTIVGNNAYDTEAEAETALDAYLLKVGAVEQGEVERLRDALERIAKREFDTDGLNANIARQALAPEPTPGGE